MENIFFFVLGAVIGSFLNVCIYRLPLGKSIVLPASHCPYCGHNIKWYDNIPLLSFIWLRGRCRYCSHQIPLRYPIVELLTAIFTVWSWHKWGLSLQMIVYLFFIYDLIVVSFIDLEHRIIPDMLSIGGLVLGLVTSIWLPTISFKQSLLGALVGGGVLFLVAYAYERLRSKEGMGGGDIKLMAMIGAFLGLKAVPVVVFIASLLGSLIGISWIIIAGKSRDFQIPFGPFLAIAALISLFFPSVSKLFYP